MDIYEAIRRLWHRLPVVLLCVALGAGTGYALHAADEVTYTSSARLVLGPTFGAAPASLADEAAAIATSPTRVETAIEASDVSRDPADVASLVSVEPLGSSPVLSLSISDVDAEVAASMANSLADEVVATRQSLVEQVDAGTELGPAVIEQARPTPIPDPSRTLQDTALGALLGLLAGLAAAAALELLRPTLTTPKDVASAMATPHLGEIPANLNGGMPPQRSAGIVSPLLATVISRAAHRADVTSVRVIPVEDALPLEPLVDDLRAALAHVPVTDEHMTSDGTATAARDRLVVKRPVSLHDLVPSTPDDPSGVVVVAPARMAKRKIDPAQAVVRQLGEPVIGVVTYRPRSLNRVPAASDEDSASP